jgi:vacuolar-type H+-ATPase subunit H
MDSKDLQLIEAGIEYIGREEVRLQSLVGLRDVLKDARSMLSRAESAKAALAEAQGELDDLWRQKAAVQQDVDAAREKAGEILADASAQAEQVSADATRTANQVKADADEYGKGVIAKARDDASKIIGKANGDAAAMLAQAQLAKADAERLKQEATAAQGELDAINAKLAKAKEAQRAALAD